MVARRKVLSARAWQSFAGYCAKKGCCMCSSPYGAHILAICAGWRLCFPGDSELDKVGEGGSPFQLPLEEPYLLPGVQEVGGLDLVGGCLVLEALDVPVEQVALWR